MNRLHLICIMLLFAGALIAQQPKAIEVQTGRGTTTIKVYPGVKSTEVYSPEEKRFALVIGVGAYDYAPPLLCIKNDIDTMRRVLQKAGFDVAVALDKSKNEFEAIIDESRQYCIDNGYNIITFYYSGHGAQFNNIQMLISKELTFTTADTTVSKKLKTIMDNSILLPSVIGKLNIPNAKAVLGIIDACRDEAYLIQPKNIGEIPTDVIIKLSNIQKNLEGTANVGILHSSLNGKTSATAPVVSLFTQYLAGALSNKPGNFSDLSIRIAKEMKDKGEIQKPVNTNNPIDYDFKFFRTGWVAIANPIDAPLSDYSSQFNTNLTYGTVTDVEGNKYKTIKIGTQTWMAENLNTGTYANGDLIPNVTSNSAWEKLTTGAWCYYDNNSSYKNPYGKLYNWYTVVDNRKLCPTGWHVPSDKEWTILTNYLDGENEAGGKMKSKSNKWESPNTDATNISGFSGLPGGNRYTYDGTYGNIGKSGTWWSATKIDTNAPSYRYLDSDFGDVGTYSPSDYVYKESGFSVRCVMD